MTRERMEKGMKMLRKAHHGRAVPDIPLGFDGRVMANIRDMAACASPLERLLPQFTMGAMACAVLAMLYGMTLMDSVPQALAAMYVPDGGLGF